MQTASEKVRTQAIRVFGVSVTKATTARRRGNSSIASIAAGVRSASMTQERWTEVDRYLTDLLIPEDAVLEETLRRSEKAGLPSIQVAPNQGKMLNLIARAQGARTILEIGTLAGYSTIWLARGLPPGGRLVTLELNPKHAEVARSNFERAGLGDVIDLRVGPASEILAGLAAEDREPFDFIFIDADKSSTADYFRQVLGLSRLGTLIVVDNVVRGGAIADSSSDDVNVRGIRRFFEAAASEPRVDVTAIQTVGSKGYDGLSFALVVAEAQD